MGVAAYTRVIFSFISVLWLSGCATVDQFSSRITSENANAQYASNEEILLNIVRASYSEPLSFVAITQVAGTQQEMLNLGLPTLTFGPGQTVMQRQVVFGSNSLSNQVVGSFQSAPLISSPFQQAMITPVSLQILALLLDNYPHELVYDVLIDSIKLTVNGYPLNIPNDPADNVPPSGSASCDAYLTKSISAYSASNDGVCNYSKFLRAVRDMLDYGITAEIVPKTTQKATSSQQAGQSGTGGNATTTPTGVGQLCYDPSIATYKSDLAGEPEVCGTQKVFTHPNALVIHQAKVEAQLAIRSPKRIFEFLGALLRRRTHLLVPIRSNELREFQNEPILDVTRSTARGCFVTTIYNGVFYCVPLQEAHLTAMLLSMLEELKNLSITPSDLSSGLLVRVTD